MGTRELFSPGYGLLIELSLRNRRLEVEGARKNIGARGRHVLSFPHYFQAPEAG